MAEKKWVVGWGEVIALPIGVLIPFITALCWKTPTYKRIQFRMLHENSSSRTTKFTNNSHYTPWNHFLFATFIHCVSIFTNGWFPSKTSWPFEGNHWGPKDAPPPPKHATQVRRGLVNANFHEHGHTLHSLTSLGIGFPSTGRKSPPQLCQPVFQWGEISPLSRVSDNPSYQLFPAICTRS